MFSYDVGYDIHGKVRTARGYKYLFIKNFLQTFERRFFHPSKNIDGTYTDMIRFCSPIKRITGYVDPRFPSPTANDLAFRLYLRVRIEVPPV